MMCDVKTHPLIVNEIFFQAKMLFSTPKYTMTVVEKL